MRLVVDSNRLIASLLKDSTTRQILFSDMFEFIAPEFVKEEILKNKLEFMKKAKINSNEFGLLLSLIFDRVKIIPKNDYARFVDAFKDEISDANDIPYLACSEHIKAAGVWSHDKHFLKQKKVKIFTNKDLINLLK